jgi:hypothetical protein
MKRNMPPFFSIFFLLKRAWLIGSHGRCSYVLSLASLSVLCYLYYNFDDLHRGGMNTGFMVCIEVALRVWCPFACLFVICLRDIERCTTVECGSRAYAVRSSRKPMQEEKETCRGVCACVRELPQTLMVAARKRNRARALPAFRRSRILRVLS